MSISKPRTVFLFDLKLKCVTDGDHLEYPNKNLSEYVKLLQSVKGIGKNYYQNAIKYELTDIHTNGDYTTILINKLDATVPDPQAKNSEQNKVTGLEIDVKKSNYSYTSCHIVIKHGADHLATHTAVAEDIRTMPFRTVNSFLRYCMRIAFKKYDKKIEYKVIHPTKLKDGCQADVFAKPTVELIGKVNNSLEIALNKGMVSEVQLIQSADIKGGVGEEDGFTFDKSLVAFKVSKKEIPIGSKFGNLIDKFKKNYDKVRVIYKEGDRVRSPQFDTSDMELINKRALQAKDGIELPDDAKSGYESIHPVLASRLKATL